MTDADELQILRAEVERLGTELAENARLRAELAGEREACAKVAERDVDWATFYCEGIAIRDDMDEMLPTERGVLTYRAGIQAGRMIAAAIRARSVTASLDEAETGEGA